MARSKAELSSVVHRRDLPRPSGLFLPSPWQRILLWQHITCQGLNDEVSDRLEDLGWSEDDGGLNVEVWKL